MIVLFFHIRIFSFRPQIRWKGFMNSIRRRNIFMGVNFCKKVTCRKKKRGRVAPLC